jgi:hypothetical protein
LHDLVSDTPTHNAANYGVPAYITGTCSGNPVEMTMNYGLYRRQGNVYVFKRAKKRELFFFQVGEASFGI